MCQSGARTAAGGPHAFGQAAAHAQLELRRVYSHSNPFSLLYGGIASRQTTAKTMSLCHAAASSQRSDDADLSALADQAAARARRELRRRYSRPASWERAVQLFAEARGTKVTIDPSGLQEFVEVRPDLGSW